MLKKIIFFIVLLFVVIFNNSATQEVYVSFGNSYLDNINIKGDANQAAGGHTGMVALINIIGYSFRNNSNYGLYLGGGSYLSIYNTDAVYDKYASGVVYGIAGPGYRYSVNNALSMLFGLGLCYYQQVIEADINKKAYDEYTHNFGLAGQLGLKMDFTDNICMMFALNPAYTFVHFSQHSSKWDFVSNVALSPFIGIGLNFYNNKLGKPTI